MKQRFLTYKDFKKTFSKSTRKILLFFDVISDNVYIAKKKQMFAVKLLATSSCYIVLNMPNFFTFHIFHTTWGIIDYTSNYSSKLLTMFKQVILNYLMLNLNEPMKVAHLQKLANQCWMARLW